MVCEMDIESALISIGAIICQLRIATFSNNYQGGVMHHFALSDCVQRRHTITNYCL